MSDANDSYDAVRDLLYLEADLLDRREWERWADLYTEDCVYWVPSWATEDELAAAIEQASLTDFVASLPDGLATPVGERGARLSGGQRQRVAIARAFLKDTPVLVLDEATSHLDAVNEAAVHRSLETLMAGRTTLTIAHRLSTIRNATRIVVLEDGRLIEVGDHDTLLASGGLYARLTAHQLAAASGPG